jgi:uncharacterized protein YdhG (YjbR/CyaY superfamily)
MARTSTPDAAAATAWIDAYLGALPADPRAALQTLRETIAATAPDAIEAVSYGMPAFRYHGRLLVWYLAAKAHCSLFPRAAVIEAHRGELAGFKLAKGTIQFTATHPLPPDLVATMVRDVMAEIDARND